MAPIQREISRTLVLSKCVAAPRDRLNANTAAFVATYMGKAASSSRAVTDEMLTMRASSPDLYLGK